MNTRAEIEKQYTADPRVIKYVFGYGMTARQAIIYTMRQDGLEIKEIANLFRISRQSARLIHNAADYKKSIYEVLK